MCSPNQSRLAHLTINSAYNLEIIRKQYFHMIICTHGLIGWNKKGENIISFALLLKQTFLYICVCISCKEPLWLIAIIQWTNILKPVIKSSCRCFLIWCVVIAFPPETVKEGKWEVSQVGQKCQSLNHQLMRLSPWERWSTSCSIHTSCVWNDCCDCEHEC